ncbi:hypothetical protein GCM10020254_68550 [Streptomyces goshikiensis]
MQAQPGVGHRRIEPYGGPELLLGLRVRAHGAGVDPAQPGEFGRGVRAARSAEVHHIPHKPAPVVRGNPPRGTRELFLRR